MSHFDDIVAPITGSPPAAVAIVRISGPKSWQIAASVFSSALEERRAVYGRFATGDDGLAIAFEEGRSFTGERSVELNVHGSRAAVEVLVEACIGAGARIARPGEFTERAFLNGRIDLSQAEGIRDTIEAVTDAQLRQANLLRDGALRRRVDELRDRLLREIARLEAHIDFSEEIGDLDRPSMAQRLRSIHSELEGLLETADAGRFLREGVRIVIAGRPNAGKSSLLNALLGRDRAIVTEIAGTTRDYLEETVELGGARCILIDTAGLRTDSDLLESEGITRSRLQIDVADAAWYVFDRSVGWTSEDQVEFDNIPCKKVRVANKSDLTEASVPSAIQVSALTGEGFGDLARWTTVFSQVERATAEPLVNRRQAPEIRLAIEAVRLADESIEHQLPEDLATVQLRSAVDALGRITGAAADEEMLDRVFRDFCIGK